MSTYSTLSTETWSLRLPDDWQEKESSRDGQLYFESPDGARGLYIATWSFAPEKHGNSNSVAVEHVHAIEKRSFDEMEGYTWRVMSDEKFSDGGVEIAIMDYYAQENSYRIACKIIASLPWIVRSTLHDYDCQDWAASREEYREVLFSIEMHK